MVNRIEEKLNELRELKGHPMTLESYQGLKHFLDSYDENSLEVEPKDLGTFIKENDIHQSQMLLKLVYNHELKPLDYIYRKYNKDDEEVVYQTRFSRFLLGGHEEVYLPYVRGLKNGSITDFRLPNSVIITLRTEWHK